TADNDGRLTMSSGILTLTTLSFQNTGTGGNDSPELQISGGTLNVSGDWTISDTEPSATLVFNASGGTIVFNGGSAQTISHVPETDSGFYNLTVNNSAASASVATNLTVQNTLTLTSGGLRILSSGPVNTELRLNTAQTVTVPSGFTL